MNDFTVLLWQELSMTNQFIPGSSCVFVAKVTASHLVLAVACDETIHIYNICAFDLIMKN